jgi:TolA-binding protein
VGRVLASLAGLLIAGATVAAQQTSPEEQAHGLLEDGRNYRRDGKVKQALDNFNTIVTGFANTESVDDALLEIGRYQMEVEGSADKAREAFELVTKRYPQSDGAPGAYYYLGLLTLDHAGTSAELDDALAQFVRVQRLYPRSEWVSRALYGTALAQRKAGRLPEAVEAARRVALEYPSSEAAPAAQFQIGHALALMGEPRQAMEEFQRIRSRFPASEWAPRALDRITALYRLYGGSKPAFTLDAGFNAGSGDVLKDVRAILMTPAGTLWIASDKLKAVVPVGPDGKLGASLGGADLQSLSLTPAGDLVVAARMAVRVGPRDIKSYSVPTDKPGVTEPLEKIEAAVVTPGGVTLIADDKRKRVWRFDAKGQSQGPFPDAKERQVARMAIDSEGGIAVLDREQRMVQVYDEGGKLLRSVAARGTGWELKRPVDVAVDAFRNIYVADEEGFVYLFSPQGQLLASISGELRKPRALTIDPAGAILVYDEKHEKVLRYK